MISLRGTAEGVKLSRPLTRLVYRLETSASDSGVFDLMSHELRLGHTAPSLTFNKEWLKGDGEWIVAPQTMDYLKHGDVISLSEDGRTINALWRGNGVTNTFLLTERCDNYCLMCSQPPRRGMDDWLLDQAFEAVSLMPSDAIEIGLSGGEPTLYGDRFVDLIRHISSVLPDTAVHILSNGRRFSDWRFVSAYAGATSHGTMVGIPIYGAESSLHDYVVQATGAFEETIQGILNLGELGQPIEIRVVVHAATAPYLAEIAEFIARNLPFVDQVALMGLEMTGLARRNRNLLWIDPSEYKEVLAEAVNVLDAQGVRTLVFNHQLCLLHPSIWDFAVKSISDWKNEYDPVCADCDVVDRCGGFFYSAKYGSSSQIVPLSSDGTPKGSVVSIDEKQSAPHSWKRRLIPITAVEPNEVTGRTHLG